MTNPKGLTIGRVTVQAGETVDVHLEVSERYTGEPVSLPIRVVRGARPGPRGFVTAGIHGDELNGVGVLHELAFGPPLVLSRRTLILVLVVNIFGFETQVRNMPDRRDLNRCFPGSKDGSLSSRIAHVIFKEIVTKSDYGIDLHSAAAPRINFPNVRGDLSVPAIQRLAAAFGYELIINSQGPPVPCDGRLRNRVAQRFYWKPERPVRSNRRFSKSASGECRIYSRCSRCCPVGPWVQFTRHKWRSPFGCVPRSAESSDTTFLQAN